MKSKEWSNRLLKGIKNKDRRMISKVNRRKHKRRLDWRVKNEAIGCKKEVQIMSDIWLVKNNRLNTKVDETEELRIKQVSKHKDTHLISKV